MPKLADVYYEVGYQVDDSGLNKSNKKLGSLDKKTQGLNKNIGSLSKAFKALGVAAAIGTAVAYISKATNEFADFEDQLLKVNAKGDMTVESYKKLKDAAFEAGATTRFSATESAKGLEYMAMAGWSAEKSIAALPAVLDLAIVSGEDLALVTDILTDQMTAFGLEADQAGHFADVLSYGANKANTSVAQLGDGMKYAAPPAKMLGMNVEETTALFMSMADGGIKASQAGTTLRAGLLRLVNPSKQAQKVMKKLGLQIKDGNGNFVGMSNFLEQLEDKTKKYTNVQKGQILSILFGQEATSGFVTILEQGTDKLKKNTEALKNNTNYSKEAAEYMNSGLKGALAETKSKQEALTLAIGETFSPHTMAAVKTYNSLLDNMLVLTRENKDEISDFGYFVIGMAEGISSFAENTWTIVKAIAYIADKATFGELSRALEDLGAIYDYVVDVGKGSVAETNSQKPVLKPGGVAPTGPSPRPSLGIKSPQQNNPTTIEAKTTVENININVTNAPGANALDEKKLAKMIKKEIEENNKKTSNIVNPRRTR